MREVFRRLYKTEDYVIETSLLLIKDFYQVLISLLNYVNIRTTFFLQLINASLFKSSIFEVHLKNRI